MEKQDRFDKLFSDLKDEIKLDNYHKRKFLHSVQTGLLVETSPQKRKTNLKPLIVSISGLLVTTFLVFLFTYDFSLETPNNKDNALEPIISNHSGTSPDGTSSITIIDEEIISPKYEETIFDVKNFGNEHPELKNDVIYYLSTIYKMGNQEISNVFDTAKVDENGVAIINFNKSFVDAVNNSMGTAGAGELMRTLIGYAFSYSEINTVYNLLDGNSSAWNKWLQFVDKPVTRTEYEMD